MFPKKKEMFPIMKSASSGSDAAFLASVALMLTICARDTYEAGTDEVLEPRRLRAYNELLHRVISTLRSHLRGEKGYSTETVIEMMQAFGNKNREVNAIEWALRKARESSPLPS